jgi:hypothetical protein
VLGGKTPYELWIGSKPAVSHLRTFGCVAHVKVTKPNLKKLDDRSRPMIFVRYEPGLAAYRCYDPKTRSVHVSRDVIFDEQAVWDWTANQAADMSFEFTVADEAEYSPLVGFKSDQVDDLAPVVIDDVVESSGGEPHNVSQVRSPCPSAQIHEAPQQVESATPEATRELQSEISFSDNLDAAHDADAH